MSDKDDNDKQKGLFKNNGAYWIVVGLLVLSGVITKVVVEVGYLPYYWPFVLWIALFIGMAGSVAYRQYRVGNWK